jgi:transposase
MAAPKKYSDELRERAVRLVFESGRPIAHVARDLGVHREALRHWVRQADAEADTGRRRDLLTTDEREELKRLRKENDELLRANAILKDAFVYFATELDPTRRNWILANAPTETLVLRPTPDEQDDRRNGSRRVPVTSAAA